MTALMRRGLMPKLPVKKHHYWDQLRLWEDEMQSKRLKVIRWESSGLLGEVTRDLKMLSV
jgi:hypothetical protein